MANGIMIATGFNNDFNYIAENGKLYELCKCRYGWYGYTENGSLIADDYFKSVNAIKDYCDEL